MNSESNTTGLDSPKSLEDKANQLILFLLEKKHKLFNWLSIHTGLDSPESPNSFSLFWAGQPSKFGMDFVLLDMFKWISIHSGLDSPESLKNFSRVWAGQPSMVGMVKSC